MHRLGLMVFLLATAMAPRGAAALPDHLKCYTIKDPVKLAGVLDLDTPQFGPEAGCKVSKAKLFCVPSTKVVVAAEDKATGLTITPLPFTGAPAAEDRICYKVSCPSGAVPDQLATDQFGTRTLTKFKASLVCTPAVKGTAYCGDGIRNGSEACDTSDLGGATCASEGFTSGTLACGQGCVLDTSGCTGPPCAPAAFLASGQTTAYAADKNDGIGGAVAVPDDGTVEAGAPLAYVDNGNGTVTDANTGLTWEKKSDDGGLHDKDNLYRWSGDGTEETIWDWIQDVNAESGTGFAGFDDWRIPNAKELQSIIDYERFSPSVDPVFHTACTPACTVTTCSCTESYFYWSSTTYAGYSQGAWVVDFGAGGADAYGKPVNNYVRAVRGGS